MQIKLQFITSNISKFTTYFFLWISIKSYKIFPNKTEKEHVIFFKRNFCKRNYYYYEKKKNL